MNPWMILAGAIVAEVLGTTAMRLGADADASSEKVSWFALVAVGYLISFALLSLVLKKIELGVAYAVWSGIGTALTAVIGIVLFDEATHAIKFAFIAMIVAGVVGLNVFGGSHHSG